MNPRKDNLSSCSTIRRSEDALSSRPHYENNSLGSVWLAEFLSYEKSRKESIAKADLLNFSNLPGSTVHPHAAKHLAQLEYSQKQCANRVPDKDTHRLNELSKKARIKFQTKKGQKQILAPYVEANTKISRVLQRTKLKKNKEDMQAHQLNDFYKLAARETQAAIKIQSQYRRLLAAQYTRRLELEVRRATQIQSCARVFLAKKCLGALKAERGRATLARDLCIRMYIARCRRRKMIKQEYDAAVRCQSAVRMFFAKCMLHEKRLHHLHRVNRHRWKCLTIRLACSSLRTNFYARQIQCVVRRKLAKKRATSLFTLYSDAAVRIQCVWRCFSAKAYKDNIVYKATEDKRLNKIRVIASEKEYWKRRLENLTKPIELQHLNVIQVQKKQLELERSEKGEEIRALESHYDEQKELQRQLSPRTIAGGWEQQIQTNLKDTRERITEAKFDLLFRIQMRERRLENELELMTAARCDAKESLRHWSDWHESEQDRLWEFQRRHNREVEKKELRRSVVNEIMRWTVKHWMPSGKPDKRKALVKGTGGSGDRVQKLINAAKEKADEYQALQHAEHTFRPFQKMWDNLGVALSDLESKVTQTQKRHVHFVSTHDGAPTGQTDTLDEFDHSSRNPQRKSYPSKLPWKLLEKVRDERIEIAASLQPK
ncbi:hypothetical protein HJC23_009609 [Cyclotella cryptica]|uniref:Uncharacterized protein n=1 Tax=Cyclotella cryptica TaxID=29204 RepID=A0ABD3NW22_9STRA